MAGWMPGAYDTAHTPGYKYLMDWPMDDQPVWLRTRAGPITALQSTDIVRETWSNSIRT